MRSYKNNITLIYTNVNCIVLYMNSMCICILHNARVCVCVCGVCSECTIFYIILYVDWSRRSCSSWTTKIYINPPLGVHIIYIHTHTHTHTQRHLPIFNIPTSTVATLRKNNNKLSSRLYLPNSRSYKIKHWAQLN